MLIFGFFLLAGCSNEYDSNPGSNSGPVDAVFAEWDRLDSPGCALAVVRKGQMVYERGYGTADLEHGVPITPDSVFYVGSVSKQFVAFTLLLLEEQGRLSLDDDIRKYLKDFPEYGTPITIRHLIHHTSGIRDYLELWRLSGRDYLDHVPAQAAYDLICRQEKLNFQPGERHQYSNSCYFLMPMIVKKVTGQSFKDFAQNEILGPLGMDHSHFHDETTHIIEDRVTGYEQRPDGGFGSLAMRFALVGSGGLYTTVRDLTRWDANFYRNELGRGGPEIIKKMYSNGRLSDGTELDYACALVNSSYRGLRTVRHSGALGGYRAELLRFPDQEFSVIILSNLAGMNPLSLAYSVADLLLQDELDEENPAGRRSEVREGGGAVAASDRPLTESELTGYVGEFFSRELRTWYRISVRRAELYLKIDYSVEQPLTALDGDHFSGNGFQMHFQRDSSQRVRGFLLDSEGVNGLEFVKSLPGG